MDAKTFELSFLATLALFCALAAWAVDNPFFGFVFAGFGATAGLGLAVNRWPLT
jgi:hypothetical protein